jgi:hypothetical protein
MERVNSGCQPGCPAAEAPCGILSGKSNPVKHRSMDACRAKLWEGEEEDGVVGEQSGKSPVG